jgi:hypothetical protein
MTQRFASGLLQATRAAILGVDPNAAVSSRSACRRGQENVGQENPAMPQLIRMFLTDSPQLCRLTK